MRVTVQQTGSAVGRGRSVILNQDKTIDFDTDETLNAYYCTCDAPQTYNYEPAMCPREQKDQGHNKWQRHC